MIVIAGTMSNIEFDEIRELAKLIKQANVNSLELFSAADFNDNSNLMTKFFHGICRNDIAELSDLKKFIYKTSNVSQSTFRRLFFRFREKLLNTLFFINTNSSKFTIRAISYYECAKRFFISRMISERGFRYAALSIADDSLKIAIKFEFSELALNLSKFIITLSGAMNYRAHLISYYKDIYYEAKNMYLNELKFSEHSRDVTAYLNSSHKRSNNPMQSNHFENLIHEAWECMKAAPSIELISSCCVLILNYNKYNGKFNEFKNNTLLFIDELFKKPFLSVFVLEYLVNEFLKVVLITKDLSTCILIKRKYFNYFNEISFNWFVIRFGYIQALLHCHEYFSSYQEINMVFNIKSFNKQPPIIKQNYLVGYAYIYFLYKIGKIKGVTPDREFRINKFLNEVPEYSKDKQGVNIPIILIQILFFLADHKHHLIIDRMDSLKLYAYRYLKKDENFRSQCFIRMLGEMVRAGFKRQGTLFRTKALTDKLKLVPIDTYPATAENEIIPYEDLWEMVVGLLK